MRQARLDVDVAVVIAMDNNVIMMAAYSMPLKGNSRSKRLTVGDKHATYRVVKEKARAGG